MSLFKNSHSLKYSVLSLVLLGAGLLIGITSNSAESKETVESEASRLAIVWTSGDPEVAHRMVLMYSHAAKKAGWFDEVRLIVWGPSSRLLAGDKDLQAKLKEMQKDGVILQACVVCANSYGVSEQLRELGLEVKGMGGPLSELVKDDSIDVLTF